MDKSRHCGCKGCRTCLICENEYNIQVKSTPICKENGTYVYCPFCNRAWPGWDLDDYKSHPNHEGESIEYTGIFIDRDFLSEHEETQLICDVDSINWDLSQSGRRKQNFGPKCNFKKRKLRLGDFDGFPKSTKFVQEKFVNIPIMKAFQTIEQCSLEYDPQRGASIDPHIDDCWIWGERIVTVNLLSDSVLTMTYNDKLGRYNLDCVKDYPSVLNENGKINTNNAYYDVKPLQPENKYPIVRIPMPRRSLLIMYGSARYDWEHQVLRDDIKTRRVCLAYREFTPPYLKHGAKYSEGRDVTIKANRFWE